MHHSVSTHGMLRRIWVVLLLFAGVLTKHFTPHGFSSGLQSCRRHSRSVGFLLLTVTAFFMGDIKALFSAKWQIYFIVAAFIVVGNHSSLHCCCLVRVPPTCSNLITHNTCLCHVMAFLRVHNQAKLSNCWLVCWCWIGCQLGSTLWSIVVSIQTWKLPQLPEILVATCIPTVSRVVLPISNCSTYSTCAILYITGNNHTFIAALHNVVFNNFVSNALSKWFVRPNHSL
mmetsp:Transcript_122232/g.243333  ORF Transcript_122232/g.243333 Transcript_122232/m.243333 type:complete len:229 (-) Transcript_122232:1008-1694(-)